MQDPNPDKVIHLDARGLKCPLPVLRLRKVLQDAHVTHVDMLADDPMAWIDVECFCCEAGYTLLSKKKTLADEMQFIVQKGERAGNRKRSSESFSL